MTVFLQADWLIGCSQREEPGERRVKPCPRPITVNQRRELKHEGGKGRQTDMDAWIKNSYISMCKISPIVIRPIWLVIPTLCIYMHRAFIIYPVRLNRNLIRHSQSFWVKWFNPELYWVTSENISTNNLRISFIAFIKRKMFEKIIKSWSASFYLNISVREAAKSWTL